MINVLKHFQHLSHVPINAPYFINDFWDSEKKKTFAILNLGKKKGLLLVLHYFCLLTDIVLTVTTAVGQSSKYSSTLTLMYTNKKLDFAPIFHSAAWKLFETQFHACSFYILDFSNGSCTRYIKTSKILDWNYKYRYTFCWGCWFQKSFFFCLKQNVVVVRLLLPIWCRKCLKTWFLFVGTGQ